MLCFSCHVVNHCLLLRACCKGYTTAPTVHLAATPGAHQASHTVRVRLLSNSCLLIAAPHGAVAIAPVHDEPYSLALAHGGGPQLLWNVPLALHVRHDAAHLGL